MADQHDQALAWAQANPQDPRAQDVMAKAWAASNPQDPRSAAIMAKFQGQPAGPSQVPQPGAQDEGRQLLDLQMKDPNAFQAEMAKRGQQPGGGLYDLGPTGTKVAEVVRDVSEGGPATQSLATTIPSLLKNITKGAVQRRTLTDLLRPKNIAEAGPKISEMLKEAKNKFNENAIAPLMQRQQELAEGRTVLIRNPNKLIGHSPEADQILKSHIGEQAEGMAQEIKTTPTGELPTEVTQPSGPRPSEEAVNLADANEGRLRISSGAGEEAGMNAKIVRPDFSQGIQEAGLPIEMPVSDALKLREHLNRASEFKPGLQYTAEAVAKNQAARAAGDSIRTDLAAHREIGNEIANTSDEAMNMYKLRNATLTGAGRNPIAAAKRGSLDELSRKAQFDKAAGTDLSSLQKNITTAAERADQPILSMPKSYSPEGLLKYAGQQSIGNAGRLRDLLGAGANKAGGLLETEPGQIAARAALYKLLGPDNSGEKK